MSTPKTPAVNSAAKKCAEEWKPVRTPEAIRAGKWKVKVGSIQEEISADLLLALGYEEPYGNDKTRTARMSSSLHPHGFSLELAEAYAAGLKGDKAALEAIRIRQTRNADLRLENLRKATAEMQLRVEQESRVSAEFDLHAGQVESGNHSRTLQASTVERDNGQLKLGARK